MERSIFKQNRAPIIYFLVGAVLFISLILMRLPLARHLVAKSSEYVKLSSELARAKLAIDSMRNLKEERYLIDEAGMPSAMNAISRIARDSEVDLKSTDQMEIQKRSAEHKIRRLPIKIELEARYERIGKFINELEGLKDCVLTIDNFKIQKLDKMQPKLGAAIVASVYLEPSAAEAASPGKLFVKPRGRRRTSIAAWGRNPFVPLKTEASRISTEAGDIELAGIMWDEKAPRAIINGRVVKVRDRVENSEVVEIKKDRVILNDGKRLIELNIGGLKKEKE